MIASITRPRDLLSLFRTCRLLREQGNSTDVLLQWLWQQKGKCPDYLYKGTLLRRKCSLDIVTKLRMIAEHYHKPNSSLTSMYAQGTGSATVGMHATDAGHDAAASTQGTFVIPGIAPFTIHDTGSAPGSGSHLGLPLGHTEALEALWHAPGLAGWMAEWAASTGHASTLQWLLGLNNGPLQECLRRRVFKYGRVVRRALITTASCDPVGDVPVLLQQLLDLDIWYQVRRVPGCTRLWVWVWVWASVGVCALTALELVCWSVFLYEYKELCNVAQLLPGGLGRDRC